MRYYIADCHFWHGALNDRMDRRGFASAEEMNAYMIVQWNRKVRRQDDVVILGDFSVGDGEQTNQILRQLNGKHIWMVTGNHDGNFLKDKAFDRSRFVEITPYLELHDNRRYVICCHYPIMEYNHMYRVDEEDHSRAYMLYGHIHNTPSIAYISHYREFVGQCRRQVKTPGSTQSREITIQANLINCFCMFSDYMPLSLDEWIALDKDRTERLSRRP